MPTRYASYCLQLARRTALPLALLAAPWLTAQPYSAGRADNGNAYDAPIPGFTGPGGEGKVELPGYENPVGPTSVNPIFLNWADTVVDYSPALGTHGDGSTVVDPFWQFSDETLGPVSGDNYAVASLGDLDAAAILAGNQPGSITLRFVEPISDFTGADFAVYENGHINNSAGGVFGELAFVEVSSNGVDFARFPSVSQTQTAVGPYGSIDPTRIYNLAGKHLNAFGESWGTPFDLAQLADHPFVAQGRLDLNDITHIRLVDIPGSGDFLDSLGNPIFDAWVTWGSGGADIEAVGAIGQALTYDEWDDGRNLHPASDDDGDGWNCLAEYAFRLDPNKADGFAVTRIQQLPDGNVIFSFPRDERNASVVYIVERQDNAMTPGDWTEAARFGPLTSQNIDETVISGVATINQSPQASLGVLQEVRLTLTPIKDGGRFWRIRLEEAP